MGLFSGKRPQGLGYHAGKFKPCSWKPNCVSSTAGADQGTHHIAPFAIKGDAQAAWQKLTASIKARARVTVVQEDPGYLYAEFTSRTLGYVDDVEFALDAKAGVIHVRSAARLGVRDFGVNRARIESLRAALETADAGA